MRSIALLIIVLGLLAFPVASAHPSGDEHDHPLCDTWGRVCDTLCYISGIANNLVGEVFVCVNEYLSLAPCPYDICI